MAESDWTKIEIQPGAITTLTLTSPSGLNLLHRETIEQFLSVLDNLHDDPDIRVLMITGGTHKAFSAGAHMRELLELPDVSRYVELGERLMNNIFQFPVPVIAIVNGYALGAGFSLAMACEIRLLSSTAKVGQLAVKNGLIPPFGDTQRLMRVVGIAKAKEIIYTGRILNAKEALEQGIANHVFPLEELFERAMSFAQEIADSPTFAMRLVKETLNIGIAQGYAAGYEAQRKALIQCLEHPDARIMLEQALKRASKETRTDDHPVSPQ